MALFLQRHLSLVREVPIPLSCLIQSMASFSRPSITQWILGGVSILKGTMMTKPKLEPQLVVVGLV